MKKPHSRDERREVDLVVLSDIHLGYRGCHARTLLAYLTSIKPKRLILLGDIIDMWHFRTSFWPQSHLKAVRRLLKFAQQGVPVHYLVGNHDEAMRTYAPFTLGHVMLTEELVLDIGGERTWFTHGDRFDALLATPRWLSALGTVAYDGIAWGTCWINRLRSWRGYPPVTPANLFKRSLPSARRHIARFEEIAATQAQLRDFSAVICGHIHVPEDRLFAVDGGTVAYRNSGDWVESCSALEYRHGTWTIHRQALEIEDEHDSTLEDSLALAHYTTAIP